MINEFVLVSEYFETSDGVRLRYLRSFGEKTKDSIILVHGVGGDATIWSNEQKQLFEFGINSIAIDLRGHGLSDDPFESEAYTFKRLSQDIVELVKELKLGKVIVVGHSFGGMVSMILAAGNHPFLKGLVLVDTSYLPSFFGLDVVIPPRMVNTLRRLAHAFPQGTQQVRSSYEKFVDDKDIDFGRFISDIVATSLRSYLFCYCNIFDLDATSLLDKIEVPTMIVCGDEDTIFPPEVAGQLAHRIKNSTLTMVSGANHLIVISKPKDLTKIIIDFVSRL